MVRRLLSKRVYRLLFMLAVVLAVAVAAFFYFRSDRLPALEEMGIDRPAAAKASVLEGAAWQAVAVDAEGFTEVADNGQFVLLLDGKTSQVAVRDKKSGYAWRSNPTKAQLAEETVKGALLENLQSPFVAEYVVAGQTKRSVLSALTKGMAIDYTKAGDSIQAKYTFAKQKLSFVIQYTLTDRGLEVTVPSDGIQETGDGWIYSLNLLPYFGTVQGGTGTAGYLFVPDGPGGLIYYDRVRPAVGSGYEFAIYGDDPAQSGNAEEKLVLREQIAYPVFGLKRDDHAFAAIVKEGQYTAKVKAVLPGAQSRYHSVSVSFNYREEYGRKISGISQETVSTIRKNRDLSDRRVEYRLLSGDEANYVGMAHTYRDYLQTSGGLGGQLPPVDNVPLVLSVVGGGNKPKFGRSGYEAATTFKQAEQIVDELAEAGVTAMNVTYQGWQNSGSTYTDDRFPIVSAIGGTDGAKRFVANMHEKGIKVLFDDYMGWKDSAHSTFYKKSDGIRGIDSTVLSGPGGSFIVNPVKAVRQQKEVVDALKAIGVDGIHYADGPGSLTYSDYQPDDLLTRGDTVYYYQELLAYVRKELGTTGVKRGEAYALKDVDYIEGFPSASSRDFVIDETVPFYPIVAHGTVAYTTVPGNMRDNYEDEFLRAIEYGALPFFRMTYAESRVLKRTSYQSLYSSQFAVWKDRIVEEYEQFNQLAAVYHLPIVNHERIADGVYATTYENGTKVTVDYNEQRFSVEEGGKS